MIFNEILNLKGFWLTRDEIIDALDSGKTNTTEALLALEILDETGDTHAHFGTNGGFLFTKTLEVENVKRV
jgi:hypothetical protein